MNIELMILVDKIFGQIICYFLYLLQLFSQKLKVDSSPPKQDKDLKKILIIKFWGMGSILLATQTICNLKYRYPNSEISMLTLKQNQTFCNLIKSIDRTIVFSPAPTHLFIFNFLKLIKEIRENTYDLLIDLEFGVNFSAIVAFFVRAKEKIGFDAVKYWRGKLYIRKVPFDHGRHVSRIFNKMIKGIDNNHNFQEKDIKFDSVFNLDPQAESRLLQKLRDEYKLKNEDFLIIMNINASSLNQNRRWPLEYYVDLCKDLIKENRNMIALIGAQEDVGYVKEFTSFIKSENILDLSGQLQIEELIYLIKNCNVFIGNDSGPLHIACALDKPTVSFFGPETPLLYGPPDDSKHIVFYKDIYCSPCLNIYNSKTFICHDNQCLKQITPEEVKQEIKEILPKL